MNQTHRHTALFTALSSLISLAAGIGIWFVAREVFALSAWLLVPVATLGVAAVLFYMLRTSVLAGYASGSSAAHSDAATKLPSQTVARQLLMREFAAAERGRKLTIVLFTVDNLARLIATKPAEANRIMLAVGAILKRRTRGMNMSARLEEGHTFISILGGVDEFGAEKFVAKVGRDLASLSKNGPSMVIRYGLAGYEPELHSVDDLIAKAQVSMTEIDEAIRLQAS